MAGVTRSQLSTEWLTYSVNVSVGTNPIDTAADAVSFAIVKRNTVPITTDFVAGSWFIDPSTGATYARVLVGPSGGDISGLGWGYYDVYMKITDNPEVPVVKVDTLTLY